MIEVRFLRKSGDLVAFTYEGHADYDEYGKDIVCAAVTAQCMMAYNGLDMVLKVKNRIDLHEDGGYISVSIDGADASEKKDAQVIMETLLLGIKAIKLQYGHFINLIEEEV